MIIDDGRVWGRALVAKGVVLGVIGEWDGKGGKGIGGIDGTGPFCLFVFLIIIGIIASEEGIGMASSDNGAGLDRV